MIINKISDKNNSKIIAEKYVDWLNSGVSPSQILVLTFNSNSKKNILKNILNFYAENCISDIKIHTFHGLIYNTILDNWAKLESLLKNNTKVQPNLTGLEISQYILKDIIKQEEVKGYNSKKSLLHQIFRRYSLIVNNNLSSDTVRKRSAILKEGFGKDAETIVKKFMSKTIDLRSFDYNRQAQIFTFIYTNTDYFNGIKYLVLEDGDEATPLLLDFISHISDNLDDFLVLADKNGGSRCGYLCADINAYKKIETIFDEIPINSHEDEANITALKENILRDKKNILSNVTRYSLSKRIDMLEMCLDKISDLIKSGVKPSEISVITPIQDKMLKYTFLNNKDFYPMFISGSEKLTDNPLVKTILTILKISEKQNTDEYDIRIIFSKYLNIPIKNCKYIFEKYKETKSFPEIQLGIYSNRYDNFRRLIDSLDNKEQSLAEKALHVYNNLPLKISPEDLKKFNFFLKELQDFEKVFCLKNNATQTQDIITQIENSIISENPYATLDISENDLVISTPQKIIDNKITAKYQFWLDTSSSEWVKADIGPLYNSWVFGKDWNKNSYTIEDNINLTKNKTYRVLRKLFVQTDKIFSMSSLFDTQGAENLGGIEKYLVTTDLQESANENKKFRITPRDDQRPVLEYKNGTMAISAVPGAGKTTILLALIIELMKKGVNPENIFVLTYMESASRNFKDRIKSANPESTKLPNISTIHGLALRILKENSNYERLNLSDDFEICDDIQRGNIIKSISSNLSKDTIDEFERNISTLKLSGTDTDIKNNQKIENLIKTFKGSYDDVQLGKFLRFFYSYQDTLRSDNLIDYDDILISAVKLLEENSDIREYYQNNCEYIIEDEAQDSSEIQQRLINLLSQKHKNLIRCGDINQAITTTFTNADVEGFKKYLTTSDKLVKMNQSQRCTKGIWELANTLVKYGNKDDLKPFYEIFMNPVEGKNPKEDSPIHSKIFDSGYEEKTETVKTIKNLILKKPNCTIGILLRNNYQVNQWADYLNSYGLTAITRNECLGQKSIFKVIFSILKFISEPYDNVNASAAYKSLAECGFLKPNLDRIITDYPSDFISLDNDEISDSNLSRFHWDMNYWLSFPELTIDELALKIGLNYFSKTLEKSNIYLISTLCAKLNTGTYAQTIQKLEDLSKRPNLSGFKFFSEEEDKENIAGKIQIMTLHKSKGDEFDYVFLPEMSEKNLTLDINKLKIKKTTKFTENVRSLSRTYSPKTEQSLKEFLLYENYRLLYVGITRAKLRLYISSHEKENYRGIEKNVEPSVIFNTILQ